MSVIQLNERSAFPGRLWCASPWERVIIRLRQGCWSACGIVKWALCVCGRACDRAGGWALCPADWGTAQTLSQMPLGRTDRSFVQGAQRAGSGTCSPNTITTINTYIHVSIRGLFVHRNSLIVHNYCDSAAVCWLHLSTAPWLLFCRSCNTADVMKAFRHKSPTCLSFQMPPFNHMSNVALKLCNMLNSKSLR